MKCIQLILAIICSQLLFTSCQSENTADHQVASKSSQSFQAKVLVQGLNHPWVWVEKQAKAWSLKVRQ